MSVDATLLEMFSATELTVPVSLGAASTRGYWDEAGELVPAGATQVQVVGPILHLKKGSLAGLTQNVRVTVGALGAASAAGGREYTVHRIDPIQDGQIESCRVGGGR